MVQAVHHPTRLQEYVLAPYLEGAERLNRAWAGVDFHSLLLRPLSLKERLIALVAGLSLLLPLVNLVVWVAWQTFGSPEILSSPFFDDEPSPLPEPFFSRPPILAAEVAVPPPQIKRVTHHYNEIRNGVAEPTTWTIETSPHQISALKKCKADEATSLWTRDWKMREYHVKSWDGSQKLDVIFDKESLKATRLFGDRAEEKIFPLKENVPWIQQPTLGFSPFARSLEKELHFYMIKPDSFDLVEIVATKKGDEVLLKHGKTIRVELKQVGWAEMLPRWVGGGTLWIDPQSGVLKQMEASIPFLLDVSSEYLRSETT